MQTPIISVADLAALMRTPSVRLIDARVGAEVKTTYQNLHLVGAIHIDLDEDMAARKENAADGGRHPLPPIADFATYLGHLGISPETHLIVYDDKNGSNAAARFWWMMRAMGHQKVQVLDGGWQAAVSFGLPTSNIVETYPSLSPYPADNWQLMTADIDEVENAAADKTKVVIDVRDAARYRGEVEPIDLIAGHIPGAINKPFVENLDATGHFHSKETLDAQYSPLFEQYQPEQIIVHCGSGVTACHTILAMAQAGLPMPKMYVGSWSEWSRRDKPIGLGTD
jgi:thiosulfate/3-mercaptopyruvate sulfurtransferase